MKLKYLLTLLTGTLIWPSAQAECSTDHIDLIAGGGNPKSAMDVGDVMISAVNGNLYITYQTIPGWVLTETHLEVATSLGAIPQKNGNPIPGQFSFSGTHDHQSTVQYMVPNPGGMLYIAAHGVVAPMDGGVSGLAALCDSLPPTVAMSVKFNGWAGIPSYVDVSLSGGTWLDGLWDGWCVDTDRNIDTTGTVVYDAVPFCSYEPLPAWLFEHPENLDLVNFLLNEVALGNIVGMPSACGGAYTFGDVQRAIWELVDDAQSTSWLGPWEECRVLELLAFAAAGGDGFIPGCGDYVGIILIPYTTTGIAKQPIMIPVAVPCVPTTGEPETAWGVQGFLNPANPYKEVGCNPFPGKNWAQYILFDPTPN